MAFVLNRKRCWQEEIQHWLKGLEIIGLIEKNVAQGFVQKACRVKYWG